MKINAITPLLPSAAMPDADWADAFECKVAKSYATARDVAECTIGKLPAWARNLSNLRNKIVAPLGLKTGEPEQAKNKNEKSTTISSFPIIEEDENHIILGFDDWHLNFRLIIEQHPEMLANQHPPLAQTHIIITTLIRRNNLFGRIYLIAITPFHKLIVRSILKQAA